MKNPDSSLRFKDIRIKTIRYFFTLVFPPLLLFGVLVLSDQSGKVFRGDADTLAFYELTFFLFCLIFGTAFPLFFRTSFVRKCREGKIISIKKYLRYQLVMGIFSLIALFALSGEYLLDRGDTYLYGSVLTCLYGLLLTIPDKKKLEKDLTDFGFLGQLEDGDKHRPSDM